MSILAGPGSGKSTTLAGRIAYLVDERDVPPTSILAITSPTAAAATLRARLETVLSPDDLERAADPWLVSVPRLECVLERFRVCGAQADDFDSFDEQLMRDLAECYERELQAHGAVDYPAMLLLTLRLLELDPRAAGMLQDAYRHVLIDETQDSCRLQYRIVQHVVTRRRNVALVGDPLQSVYSFRGADPRLLQRFSNDYPDARRFVLDQNHRSTATIVTLANSIAAPLASRPQLVDSKSRRARCSSVMRG